MARPPIDPADRRSLSVLTIRWSPAEAALVRAAAERVGLPASELVRSSALDAARRILEWVEVPVEVVPTDPAPARRPWWP